MLFILLLSSGLVLTEAANVLGNLLGRDILFSFVSESFTPCRLDLLRMARNFKNATILHMLDSFGKPESGFLRGNYRYYGSQSECAGVSISPSISPLFPAQGFEGKHCILYWKPRLKAALNLTRSDQTIESGSCFPSTCSSEELLANYRMIQGVLDSPFPAARRILKFLHLVDVKCSSNRHPLEYIGGLTIFLLIMLALPTVLTLVVGCFTRGLETEKKKKKVNCMVNDHPVVLEFSSDESIGGDTTLEDEMNEEGSLVKVLDCFNGGENIRAILSTKASEPRLSFIHGLKVITTIWIIIAQVQLHKAYAKRDLYDHEDMVETAGFQFIRAANSSTDTYLFLSAFLLVYGVVIKNKSRLSKRAAVVTIISRYVRIVPAMLVALAINVNVIGYMGAGPMWSQYLSNSQSCSSVWWTFPLLAHNFVPGTQKCCGWLWYLAVDFQLFTIGVLVLTILQRFHKIGIASTFLLLLGTIATSSAIAYFKEFTTLYDVFKTMSSDIGQGSEMLDKIFSELLGLPYTRGTAFWVGFLYTIYAVRTTRTSFLETKSVKRTGMMLTVSSLLFLYPVFLPYLTERDRTGNAIYHSLSRLVWATGLVIIFHLCLTTPRSILFRLLSWRLWRPLSKLSYSVCLIHPLIADWLLWNSQQTVEFSQKRTIALTSGIIVSSFTFSFVFCLLFEVPFSNIGRLLLGKKNK